MSDQEMFVQRFQEAWRSPRGRFVELFHADGRLLQQGMERFLTRNEIPEHIEGTLKLMPDIAQKIKLWVASGDHVFIEWTGLGTVLGRKHIEWDGASRFTLKDGLIMEEVAYYDTFPLRVIADPSLARGDMFRAAATILEEEQTHGRR